MTKEEILGMEAGVDLDELVAQTVMKMRFEIKQPYLGWPEGKFWFDEYNRSAKLEHYSTNILATWQLLKKLREGHYCIEIKIADGCWVIMELFKTPPIRVEVNAGTSFERLPEAICKAALLCQIQK